MEDQPAGPSIKNFPGYQLVLRPGVRGLGVVVPVKEVLRRKGEKPPPDGLCGAPVLVFERGYAAALLAEPVSTVGST